MAFIESLLARKAGEVIELDPDFCVITDGPGHDIFSLLKADEIKDKKKTVIIFDHDIPAGSFNSAAIQKDLIKIAQEYDLEFIQSKGIGYHVMLDQYVKQGNIIVSCGEHNSVYGAAGAIGLNLSLDEMASVLKTGKLEFKIPETVYISLTGSLKENVTCKDFMLKLIGEFGEKGFSDKIIEFCGPAIESLNMTERMTLCALAGRAGAVTALINEKALIDSKDKKLKYSLDNVKPYVALPGDLNTSKPVDEIDKTALAACFIGGCTGGRLEDLRSAAEILRGKRVATDTRLTIAPATNEVYLAAIEEGLIDTFIDCGAQIINPGCASCVTTSKGVIGDGEAMLSASCYNYPGCNGTKESKVFVSDVKTAAASALAGYICSQNK